MDGNHVMVPADEYMELSRLGELVYAMVDWLKRPENVELREWLVDELKGS